MSYSMNPSPSDLFSTNPNYPTLNYLRMMRHQALGFALHFYGKMRDAGSVPEILRASNSVRYWTSRAFHYQGELLARLERPEFPVYYDAQGREHESF